MSIVTIKPLQLLFHNYMMQGVFPNIWKTATILPVHKKTVNNYLTIINQYLYYQSAKKIFENLLFDSIYGFLYKSCLLNSNQSAIIFIIFWDFLMFYQIFLSPQVKRCAIITYKHGMYELLHELPKELRLRILGN